MSDRFESGPGGAAIPPAILRYRISELVSISEFLRIGEGCAGLIQRRAGDMGMDFARGRRILDFGCGCGRTIRWLLQDCEAEFHGADVDGVAIDWCREHLPRGHFLTNRPSPPLSYPSEYFDAVYCLSVFTHLNEAMQDAWLAELSRLLKPGGVLLLSTFRENGIAALNAEHRAALAATGFVHIRSKKLKGLVPDWYQTTWHSREYITRRLSAWFYEIRYFEVSDGVQNIVGGIKRASAGRSDSAASDVD